MEVCVYVQWKGKYKLLLSIWNKLGLEWDKEQIEVQSVTREVTHNFASMKHFKSSWLLLQALEQQAGLSWVIQEQRQFSQ